MLWDYSYHTFDLFGYVCLEMTVLWGVLIMFAMAVVWPLLESLVLRIPSKAAKRVAAACVLFIFADLIFNFLYLLVKKHRLVLF